MTKNASLISAPPHQRTLYRTRPILCESGQTGAEYYLEHCTMKPHQLARRQKTKEARGSLSSSKGLIHDVTSVSPEVKPPRRQFKRH